MRRLWMIVMLIALVSVFSACKGTVTETGNCQGTDCPTQTPVAGDEPGDTPDVPVDQTTCDDATAELDRYTNAAYGAAVGYPSCWDEHEYTAGDATRDLPAIAEFSRESSACPSKSLVNVAIARMGGGETLRDIAESAAAGCVLQVTTQGGLAGFSCDLLTAKEKAAGLALKGQYVLSHGSYTYATVSVAVCSDGASGARRILQNITLP